MGKLVVAAVSAILLGSAYHLNGSSPTLSITELNEKSHDLNGQIVTVKGFVLQSGGVFGAGGFVLSDGASEVLIISDSGIPQFEAEVEVTGTFRSVLVVNEFEYGVIYRWEETRWGG